MQEELEGPPIDYAQLKKDDNIANSLNIRIKQGTPAGNIQSTVPAEKGAKKEKEIVFKLVQKGKKPVLAEAAKSAE
jgi:hypothetical protein